LCGLAAVWGPGGPGRAAQVRRMLDQIAHRGHESALARLGRCVMGVTRLPVTDVAGSRQPMADGGATRLIGFNGEIYNFRELRREHLPGVALRTAGDTETVLELVARESTAALPRLDGMFAMVVYDAARDRILAARDPLGIKPLYLVEDGGDHFFASEIKALLAAGLPAARIRQLPPGHFFDGRDVRAFDRPVEPVPGHHPPDLDRCAGALRDLLARAVEKRIATEVPTGLLLSGGIDSSVIAHHLAAAGVHGPAYTVGLAGAPDLAHARAVGASLGLHHRVREVAIDDVGRVIPEVVRVLENFHLYAVLNAIPAYFAFEAARQDGTTVLLCGEGSDEIFGGYDFHFDHYPPAELDRSIRRSIAQLHRTELHRIDRLSMAHTLEARVPFLDREVVRFALGLPDELRWQADPDGGRTVKRVLRHAYRDLLPAEVVWRPKHSFFRSAGIEQAVDTWVRDHASERDLAWEEGVRWGLRSPAERHFFRIWRDLYPELHALGPAHFRGAPEKRLLNTGLTEDDV